MVPVDLVGFGMVFTVLAALAVLVKYERRLSRWLTKSPRRSQEKSGGSRETCASVSLGSAGAGEKKLRTIQRDFWHISEISRSRRLNDEKQGAGKGEERRAGRIARAAGIGG